MDPDPDPVGSATLRWIRIFKQFQPTVKLNYTFSRKFQYFVQNIKTFTPMTRRANIFVLRTRLKTEPWNAVDEAKGLKM